MKLKDLTRVENLDAYLEDLLASHPTETQLEKLNNIAYTENLIRHINHMANVGFIEQTKRDGFEGMLRGETQAEYFDQLISNPMLIPFVQWLLLLLCVTGEMVGEEASGDSDSSLQEPFQ